MQKITILGLAVAISMASGTMPTAEAEPIPSPYQQVQDGVPIGEIVCSGARILMQSPSGMPACVFVDSIRPLEARGFVLLGEITSDAFPIRSSGALGSDDLVPPPDISMSRLPNIGETAIVEIKFTQDSLVDITDTEENRANGFYVTGWRVSSGFEVVDSGGVQYETLAYPGTNQTKEYNYVEFTPLDMGESKTYRIEIRAVEDGSNYVSGIGYTYSESNISIYLGDKETLLYEDHVARYPELHERPVRATSDKEPEPTPPTDEEARDDLSAKQPGASEKAGETGSPDASKTGDRPFVTTWRTASPNESITISVGSSTGAYTVDWGDGTVTSVTGDASHAYASPGEYQVVISGDFTRIYLNGGPNAEKLQSIDQWGGIQWESMNSAFWGATNTVYRATDVPDLSGVTDMSAMFFGAHFFNGDISPWDVSGVTGMSLMFVNAGSFNGDISPWDVSGVTGMFLMFADASSFNGDISPWDVSGVTDMSGMFAGADSFTQNLGSWYITLDDTSIDDGDATRTVGNISAQNSFLGGQSLRYSIAPGGDGDAFEIDGTVLKLKSTPNYASKSSYTVTISSTGGFGTSNSETFEIRVV